jgi:hypothetical protein
MMLSPPNEGSIKDARPVERDAMSTTRRSWFCQTAATLKMRIPASALDEEDSFKVPKVHR